MEAAFMCLSRLQVILYKVRKQFTVSAALHKIFQLTSVALSLCLYCRFSFSGLQISQSFLLDCHSHASGRGQFSIVKISLIHQSYC